VTETPPPFPGPLAAVWLTVGSWLVADVMLATLVEPVGPITALGIALSLGLGVTGTLAARSVPPPQAERIGLRGFAIRILPALILLIPVALLASEIDNVVRAFVPIPDATSAETASNEDVLSAGLFAFESAIVMVGIAPVVEEFFFRGVVQQGLISVGGVARGLFGAALLYALGHGNLAGATGWISATLGAFVTGIVLGYVRLASGSLLASILLSMAISAAGLAAMNFEEELPIPGFNAPGAHTPVVWLLPAAISVALGLLLLSRERAHSDTEPSPGTTLEAPNDGQP
jgi:membrane protease YdiL (CAAX protease family)